MFHLRNYESKGFKRGAKLKRAGKKITEVANKTPEYIVSNVKLFM